MAKIISMKLSEASIDAAIAALQAYSDGISQKGMEICRRLANIAELTVSQTYASAPYVGEKDYVISVEEVENGYAVIADGHTVLILEFGAGIRYAYDPDHPLSGQFGMGPGTYPGQTHAFDEWGWWLPKDKGGQHTYGNPPSMGMYYAGKELREQVEAVAREVFRT